MRYFMADFSSGFSGYEKAEDIHGQIRLCLAAGNSLLHLKNMNFNFACRYSPEQAKQVRLILDREGVKALSLWVAGDVEAQNAVTLAGIYGVEYIVAETAEIKNAIEKLTDKYTVIAENEKRG
jgi:hypothetical protein